MAGDGGRGGGREVAVLGGGCFWCIEAVFKDVRGVLEVVSGYAGGQTPFPTYEAVCGGRTGHAEVVQVTFDPAAVSYRDILQVFFAVHDPTTLNRQGPDVGTQYRSAIFTQGPDQQRIAREVIGELTAARLWEAPIVTEVKPLDRFYRAEGYHQDYFAHNPNQRYCALVVAPKVAKFRKQFVDRLKTSGPGGG